ncbi:MAG: SRPBCC domain-containing protein [Polyangiaceae bacterium]|nr:SRPBCC domain-containing protein [Myxococcales bacterium]MCB9590502.1 SRPBCC domain-containing protein [Polyangiaceae bacterium]MCB9608495.1 SRPBCC domain-containing protein [Polyangiaceae bacterium]
MESDVEDESARELTIIRVFDVPARILFLACSKPEHMREWFGPTGFPLTTCEMDFRVGGRFRFAMTGPDGAKTPFFGGEYLQIEPNRRISYTSCLELPGAETMIVTLSFDEVGGTTTLTHHTLFASIAMMKQHTGMGYRPGVESGLDQLGRLATELNS